MTDYLHHDAGQQDRRLAIAAEAWAGVVDACPDCGERTYLDTVNPTRSGGGSQFHRRHESTDRIGCPS